MDDAAGTPPLPFGADILLSAVLHTPRVTAVATTEEVAPGNCPILFFCSSPEEAKRAGGTSLGSVQQQLRTMQAVFASLQRPSTIGDVRMCRPTTATGETLCFYENALGGVPSRTEDESALFSCHHLITIEGEEAYEEWPATASLTPYAAHDAALTAMFHAPVLIFDDRYGARGFWPFLTCLVQYGAGDFEGPNVTVQLQGLAVPQVHRSGEAGSTFDLFYQDESTPEDDDDDYAEGEKARRASVFSGSRRRSATKQCVTSRRGLRDALTWAERACGEVEEHWGVPHLVFYLTFLCSITDRRVNLCVVRLTHTDSTRLGDEDLLSSEVLRLLVEELTLGAVEGPGGSSTRRDTQDGINEGEETVEDDAKDSVFDEPAIAQAFTATQLTRIVQKVIVHNYARCRDTRAPLFHWLCNFPECEVVTLCGAEASGDNRIPVVCCACYSPSLMAMDTACGIIVSLQEANMARQQSVTPACTNAQTDTRPLVSPVATGLHFDTPADTAKPPHVQRPYSVVAQRRHKINPTRVYERINATTSRRAALSSRGNDTTSAGVSSAALSPQSELLQSPREAQADAIVYANTAPERPLVTVAPARPIGTSCESLPEAQLIVSSCTWTRGREKWQGCGGRRGPSFDLIPDSGAGDYVKHPRRQRPLTSSVRGPRFAISGDNALFWAILENDSDCALAW